MPPKNPEPSEFARLLSELLELRPDIERMLADEPRSSRGFCPNLEDKVQTVFLKVIQHLPDYRPHEDGLKPWITRITYNLKHDAHRSKQRREQTFGDTEVDADLAPATSISPERATQSQALLQKVFPIIAELPIHLQEVLILSAFVGMSHAEIASELGISEDAAKMRLLRAREYIRRRVGTLDDHIGVRPALSFRARRALTIFWQFSHLLPPFFVGLSAIPQWDPTAPTMDAESSISASASESMTPPTLCAGSPNPEAVDPSVSVVASPHRLPQNTSHKQSESRPKRNESFEVVLPRTHHLIGDHE